MGIFKTAAAVASIVVAGTGSWAAPLKLAPADPQPSGLKQGLAVQYAYPKDVKTLGNAERALRKAKAGKPLAGLDYRDTNDGDKTLTSDRAHHVVAKITGYVKFDAAGIYAIDFLTNDGLDAKIGGQDVAYVNGRQPCQATRPVEAEVPEAGWYAVNITYFQRLGTACLHMRAGHGKATWMENAAFGYN
ncbi:MAG: PA14 domain-containing protein [Pseudomonadota bacterium]